MFLSHKLKNLSDDHHPAPTFTPPELPKRVHVRGITAGNKTKKKYFYLHVVVKHDKFYMKNNCKKKTNQSLPHHFFSLFTFVFLFSIMIFLFSISADHVKKINFIFVSTFSFFLFCSNINHRASLTNFIFVLFNLSFVNPFV